MAIGATATRSEPRARGSGSSRSFDST
jgi:hypothetical protein